MYGTVHGLRPRSIMSKAVTKVKLYTVDWVYTASKKILLSSLCGACSSNYPFTLEEKNVLKNSFQIDTTITLQNRHVESLVTEFYLGKHLYMK